jgi:hypothetical protein
LIPFSYMKFSNSREFLKYLQDLWTNDNPPYTEPTTNKEFINIVRERFKEHPLGSVLYRKNHFDELIDSYVGELAIHLPEPYKELMKEKIAIGSVNTNLINAVCTRDKNGNHAIIINSSLWGYLHKYGKMMAALENPSYVIYCNRKPALSLTVEDIHAFLEEIFSNFFKTNFVQGALIHLNDKINHKHHQRLEAAEKFIIGHELGHYFNRHLDNTSNTELYLNNFQKLKNTNHNLENEADDFGFDLMLRWAADPEHAFYRKKALPAGIELLFRALDSLNPLATETHPAPLERMDRLLVRLKEI